MAKIEAFEKYHLDYEKWFEKNADLYRGELKRVVQKI